MNLEDIYIALKKLRERPIQTGLLLILLFGLFIILTYVSKKVEDFVKKPDNGREFVVKYPSDQPLTIYINAAKEDRLVETIKEELDNREKEIFEKLSKKLHVDQVKIFEMIKKLSITAERDQILSEEALETAHAIQKEVQTSSHLQHFEDKKSENKLKLNSKWIVLVPDLQQSKLGFRRKIFDDVIWIDPIDIASGRLISLKLDRYNGLLEKDLDHSIKIQPVGVALYSYLQLKLSVTIDNYNVQYFAFDWRKNLDIAAKDLAELLRSLSDRSKQTVSIVAHGQGALVARRSLQILGKTESLKAIRHLILLGPINYGTFESVALLDGSSEQLKQLSQIDLKHSLEELRLVFASMSGLYQLLPWDDQKNPSLKKYPIDRLNNWKVNIDSKRLNHLYKWPELIDTDFFNDRTTVIVGFGQPTASGIVDSNGGSYVRSYTKSGDGMVTVSCSVLPGVKTYYVKEDHSKLTVNISVITAIRNILADKSVELPTSLADFP